MRWVGIDEAGYGPNLGPLVMTAVVAEASGLFEPNADPGNPPDLWLELGTTIDRAGGHPQRLWIDDSKAIYLGGKGRDRLEAACLAAVTAVGWGRPGSFRELLDCIAIHDLDDAELCPWFEFHAGATDGLTSLSVELEESLSRSPLEPADASWRITAIHTAVVGPNRFNAGLGRSSSKADVHFEAFAELLQAVWDDAGHDVTISVTGDKHGGRHYYFERLGLCFPGLWIERGVEGAEASQYRIRGDRGRRLDLQLRPRADQGHGLVAIASIVSKTVREVWMDGFNRYWCARIPGLRRSAGYPLDARRFRQDIEAVALASGHHPDCWWRAK